MDIFSEWGVYFNSFFVFRERFYNVLGIEWDDDVGWSISWD